LACELVWLPLFFSSDRRRNSEGRNGATDLLTRHRTTKALYLASNVRAANRILMVIEHENDRYVGCVPFDNYFFCRMILTLLEDCHSRSLREIGELELFYDR